MGIFRPQKDSFFGDTITTAPADRVLQKRGDFIVSHAVAPDKRRYVVESEAARHYLDYDRYDTAKTFDVIPHNWCEATLKYTEDTLKKHGILPWQVVWSFRALEDAFKEQNWDEVLLHSADLGHYIADAHVPLHTTQNYNGQLTHQHGIHGFWESRVPELFFENYGFWVGGAEYIENPSEKIWEVIRCSHLAVDSVLDFEKQLSQTYPEDEKYSIEARGRSNVKTYSRDYTQKYHDLLNGMVERRMQQAVLCVASFWYTAWVNAGKPILPTPKKEEDWAGFKKMMHQLDSAYRNNPIFGREHED